MENFNFVDSCISLEVLKQDSGLLPKPKEDWNTFVPQEGDKALVLDQVYQFDGNDWIEVEN